MCAVCPSLDFVSLSVAIMGVLVTVHNSALTMCSSYGIAKGGMFMVVTLLVVGVLGMRDHGSHTACSCQDLNTLYLRPEGDSPPHPTTTYHRIGLFYWVD